MFGRKKTDPGPVIEARAVVTAVKDTGVTINNNPRVALTLEIQPAGRPPIVVEKEVTVSRLQIPGPGDPFRVKYFAKHPEGLTVQRRTPEELAKAAGAGADSAPTLTAPPADPAERIHRLHDLLESGALTEAEFEQQKAKLLRDAAAPFST